MPGGSLRIVDDPPNYVPPHLFFVPNFQEHALSHSGYRHESKVQRRFITLARLSYEDKTFYRHNVNPALC